MTLKELRSISRARDKVPLIQTILNSGGDNQRASAGSRYRFVGSILRQKGRTKNTKSEAFPRKFIIWCKAFTIEPQSIKNNRIILCFSQDEHSSIFIGASKIMRSNRWISESEKGTGMTAMRPKAASTEGGRFWKAFYDIRNCRCLPQCFPILGANVDTTRSGAPRSPIYADRDVEL